MNVWEIFEDFHYSRGIPMQSLHPNPSIRFCFVLILAIFSHGRLIVDSPSVTLIILPYHCISAALR